MIKFRKRYARLHWGFYGIKTLSMVFTLLVNTVRR